MQYTINSVEETKELAKQIALTLTGGAILCLHGDLGAGKTTFVKGLAKAFGIIETITSPTFTIMNIYNTSSLKHQNIKTVVHIDTYRLKDEHELVGIGALDYIGQHDTITVIEWPEKIIALLENKKVIHIFFDHSSTNERSIRIDN